MKKYEITYLISDDVTDSEITKTTGRVSGIVSDAEGKVLKEEGWGRRKLAYPINKKEFATYVTIEFTIDPLTINSVTKEIRMMKEVVRLIAVVVDEKKAKITLTADDVAVTKEIENVVGGEKSFEAIEGQTEESYDLMAKRGEETTKELMDEKTEKPTEKEDIKKEEPKIEDKEKSIDKVEKKAKKKAPVEKAIAKKSKPSDDQPKTEKTIKKSEPKKTVKVKKADSKATDEADRLSKLDKELDDLLGDDL